MDLSEAGIERQQERKRGDGEVDRDEIHPPKQEDVEVYIRTYTTMLRSSGEVKIKALVQAHLNADSALHVYARATAKRDWPGRS